MSKVLAYIYTSKDRQKNEIQKSEVYEYAQYKNLRINEFMQIQTSSTEGKIEENAKQIIKNLQSGDTLIVNEITLIAKELPEVLHMIKKMIEKKIRIIIAKQNLDINIYDNNSKNTIGMLFLLSELVKEEKNKQGKKPTGILQKSKFDKDLGKIKELLSLGISIRKISAILGYPSHMGLNHYIKKRKILEEIKNVPQEAFSSRY